MKRYPLWFLYRIKTSEYPTELISPKRITQNAVMLPRDSLNHCFVAKRDHHFVDEGAHDYEARAGQDIGEEAVAKGRKAQRVSCIVVVADYEAAFVLFGQISSRFVDKPDYETQSRPGGFP